MPCSRSDLSGFSQFTEGRGEVEGGERGGRRGERKRRLTSILSYSRNVTHILKKYQLIHTEVVGHSKVEGATRR